MSKKLNICNCEECIECVYLGEGDFLCGKTNKIVISDFIPTDDFINCKNIRSKDD